MEELNEECGIMAVYQMGENHGQVNVTPLVVRGLVDLQNRGQLSAGLTSYNPSRDRILQTHKALGSVHEVFRVNLSPQRSRQLMEEYSGQAAIGHTRYATSGASDSELAQPFERVHGRKWKWFAISFNGNLANYQALKDELETTGYHITYHSDTEVMMHYINRELQGDTAPDFHKVFGNLTKIFDGAFNIAFLNGAGDMVVVRDPLGIKPLCYGVKDQLLVAASESNVLLHLGIEPLPLGPGEMIVANRDGYRVERYHPAPRKAYCFFEWIYFANLASSMEGRSVYNVRYRLGAELAAQEPLKEYSQFRVIPVPETSLTAAHAFGFHLNLPVMSGLVRNRYVGRTFIEGASRADTVRMKFTPLREVLEDHDIFLLDDSLVRATTLKTVIEGLRQRGKARQIHVRIACPPIMGPCFYGIDMPTVKELFAPHHLQGKPLNELPPAVLAAMARELGADSLVFLSMEGLTRALGLPKEDMCMACVNLQYPTEMGRRRHLQAQAQAGLGELPLAGS
ncbi:MAG: amidophosphoribosyltransferase [Deltaproteobacteria bacterium]|nr:amidophosphoribosyltransferase [Deltaproteobacteria bacterium]